MVPDAALLGTQHEGLDWGKFPATYRRHVQGVYLYIKLPHATETGDRLLADGPSGLARLTKPFLLLMIPSTMARIPH